MRTADVSSICYNQILELSHFHALSQRRWPWYSNATLAIMPYHPLSVNCTLIR
jgi:hypothetical protein